MKSCIYNYPHRLRCVPDWQWKLMPEICWMSEILWGRMQQLKPHQNKVTPPLGALNPASPRPLLSQIHQYTIPSLLCHKTHNSSSPQHELPPSLPLLLSIDHCPHPEPSGPGHIQRDRRLGGLGGWCGERRWLCECAQLIWVRMKSDPRINASMFIIQISRFTADALSWFAQTLLEWDTLKSLNNARSLDWVQWPTGNLRHNCPLQIWH